jgi:predicted MPP superfamily phosphohydrolase
LRRGPARKSLSVAMPLRKTTRRSRPLGRIRLEEHEARSPLVDARHDGVRLVHLSDIHAAGPLRPRRLHRAVELANALRPHAVLLTGDYVCASARPAALIADALGRLEVPAWATLGNHDHWSGAARVAAALESAGVRVLRNAHDALLLQGAPLHLIGVDDHRTGHADPEAAFAGVGPAGTRVVLTHDPNAADALAGRGAALVLAGHTHGGQIRLPGVTAGIARRIGIKYLSGFFELGPTLLYVNRGLGAAVPLRIAAPMEVALLTLRRAAEKPQIAGVAI